MTNFKICLLNYTKFFKSLFVFTENSFVSIILLGVYTFILLFLAQGHPQVPKLSSWGRSRINNRNVHFEYFLIIPEPVISLLSNLPHFQYQWRHVTSYLEPSCYFLPRKNGVQSGCVFLPNLLPG